MHRVRFALLITAILLLTASILGGIQAQVEQQDQYTLELQKFAWYKTTLTVLITTPQNVTWWNPAFTNSTIRAVNQWNQAMADFAANYTDFANLYEVNLVPTVANESKAGFDVVLSWTENATRESGDEIGLTVITSDQFNKVVKTTINLSAKSKNNNSLNEIDTQNVALHELGHVLGLAHSNYTKDIMYPTYTLGSAIQEISTLDVYGVAVMFQWIENPADFYPIRGWLKVSSVISPTNIEYRLFEPDEKQLPPTPTPSPTAPDTFQEFIGKIIQFLLRPEILTLIVIIFTVLVIIVVVQSHKKTKQLSSEGGPKIQNNP